MAKGESIQRPHGFPYSEQEFHRVKQSQLKKIIDGGMQDSYDEWVLRGIPRERFGPTYAIGFFATPAMTKSKFVIETEEVMIDFLRHRTLQEYCRDFMQLPLTERIKAYEKMYFSAFKGKEKKALDVYIAEMCTRELLPSGIIVFSRPDQETQESVFMVSPRYVPPSATYHHLIDQVRLLSSAE